ncbi:MAG TPA: GSCFA domain-containing protein [Cyclobacteriaceae bacterium]|nr:GSCFA domain-containing protein [Cyclobacteriaceae bacterium]
MEFRTEVTVMPRPMIDHRSRIVTAGSCFADNIGQKLSESKFNALVNPLGTVYNPVSIHKNLMLNEPEEKSFIESQGLWKNFDFHSKFADGDKEVLRESLRKGLANVREFDVMMITYGTAWVYKYQNDIVANCHKRPAKEFEKELLSVEQIVGSFGKFHTNKKIILTLSPVRHIKDTLELNSVSKSILRTAIYEIQKSFPGVEYFPAYEIMMDDLRDYRFYEKDMLHPSQVAIDYIWEKFGERYFSEETRELNKRWEKVSRSLAHRAFQPGTGKHKEFLKGVLKELEGLKGELDVSEEIRDLEARII